MTNPARSRSAIGRQNLIKSKVAERAVATFLRTHGWPGAERTVRTGFEVAGRTLADRGDLDGTPGLVWQVKNVANPTPGQLADWLAETEAQRVAAQADYGVLVVKRPRYAHPGAWWAYLTVPALLELVASPWAPAWAIAAVPVRFTLAGLVPLLWTAGYGTRPGGEAVA